MKVELERTISVDDVSMTGEVLPGALLSLFQEAAIRHSAQVGYSSTWFRESGQSWMLRELAYAVHAPVRLNDSISIFTWTRGLERVRGSREFWLFRGDDKVISASSNWVYVDRKRRRPVRVPPGMNEAFEPEPDVGLAGADKNDAPDFRGCPEKRERVTIGYGDFDIIGHVNNTAYANYLQTAVYRAYGVLPEFRRFGIKFQKEIVSDTKEVEVVLRNSGNSYAFEISAEDTIRADGFLSVGK